MSISPGACLGRYEIRSQLGAGGMGEVYRARDERLNRDVAIKVLPAALLQDVERLRRFEQEAQAVGTLNHQNILAVYDIATHEGSPYPGNGRERIVRFIDRVEHSLLQIGTS